MLNGNQKQTGIWRVPALFAIIVLALARVGQAVQDESPEAAAFWSADRVHTIRIHVTAQQWQMLQPTHSPQGALQRVSASEMPRPSSMQPSTKPALVRPATSATTPTTRKEGERLEPNFYGLEFSYVKANVECDGTMLKEVGLRQRGNSSYNWGVNSGYKRPFKVSFHHFVDGQKCQGISGFYLNNNAYDPSFLRETLAYETFRQLRVPAPRTSYALVYLTIEGRLQEQYLGLYTLIEEVDSKAFLKHHFDSAKGTLMKPWSIRGLPYFGEQWEAYESRYSARTKMTPEAARRTIDFIKLVNYSDDQTFGKQIESYLNVDEFLRLLAGEVIISNLDTFLYTGHNFYLYLKAEDNRFYFMPWDMNLSFAGYTTPGSAEQEMQLSIMHPHAGEAKIVDRLLAIPQYRELYRGHIRNMIASEFNPAKFSARVDALQVVLGKADEAADAAWKSRFIHATTRPTTRPVAIPPRPIPVLAGWQGQAAVPLKTFISVRVESLEAQLAGKADGFTPGSRRRPGR